MMKNLLVGNGINIQFNNTDYTTQQIVLRILKNCDRDDFPTHIIVKPAYILRNYIGQLYLEARDALDGKYDSYTTCNAERDSLESFKKQYAGKKNTLRITDIGFEDYYLIHDLVCHKHKMGNPNQFYCREAMRVAYLNAIYNDGELNSLFQHYSKSFVDYLLGFDTIFTTNYDSNIESAIKRNVYHIHGQFDKKSDVYTEDSFRNQLPDAPIKVANVDEEYPYLYSNALTTHCGEYKELQIKQYSQANCGIEKMAAAYNNDPQIKSTVDEWTRDSNKLVANMGYAIQLKAANPSLSFTDNYHFDEFQRISGTLEILGLSPWNDFHIFESINNADLDKCIFYFFNEDDCDLIKELLPQLNCQQKLEFFPVRAFWEVHNEQ